MVALAVLVFIHRVQVLVSDAHTPIAFDTLDAEGLASTLRCTLVQRTSYPGVGLLDEGISKACTLRIILLCEPAEWAG